MSEEKRLIRAQFRAFVFGRDKYRCRLCGRAVYDRQDENPDYVSGEVAADAHHITPRDEMPYGGYVHENGITLCDPCHKRAEEGRVDARHLYHLIGTTHADAVVACDRLDPRPDPEA